MSRSPSQHAAPRRRPGPPPRFWALSEWALLPLRAFFGVTFLYAGVQKLSNPAFFSRNLHRFPNGIYGQMLSSADGSPIGGLVRSLAHYSTAVGVSIAIGEVAVGVGTVLGLWTRVAAIGGALLSLSFFLTVSFNTPLYYQGADIVFLFGWLALAIAGGASRFSVDAVVARRVAREHRLAEPELVAVPFATVQRVCGQFQDGRCAAQGGVICGPAGCPFLEGERPPLGARRPDEVDRRTVVIGAGRAAAVAGASAVVVGVVAGTARALSRYSGAPPITHPSTTTTTEPPKTTTTDPQGGTTTTTTTSLPAGATVVGTTSGLRPGDWATFTCPNGDPGLAVCPAAGTYVAYDAVCPHAGCTVGYFSASDLIVCPCHGSEFDVATGAVIQGPAQRGLQSFAVSESPDGDLYIT